MNYNDQFAPFAARMHAEGLPEIFIANFAYYYRQLVSGKTGLIPESQILPANDLPDFESFPARLKTLGEAALAKTAVIKLNGGLGTSMGLEKAKSLLHVRDGLSFLDIIARQAILSGVPLILMNSFVTDRDSLEALERYPELKTEVDRRFLQHKEPKIDASNFTPVKWPANPNLEWCPPGHGDIYVAMVTSGILSSLLAAGYRFVFVSNADNLGAVLDPMLLGYFAESKLPFMMEVADRTEMDKKGGHLAKRVDENSLILRESAQCPEADLNIFQDISRHKYFNTNNLWVDLVSLRGVMLERDNKLGLPIIINQKTVDPRDKRSTTVFQLETAMGSAIAVFQGAEAVRVPRERFAPVKKTNELLAIRSDVYQLSDAFHVIPSPERELGSIYIDLDERYYKFVSDLDQRFPFGAPSLLDCESLRIVGDIRFEKNIICQGSVTLVNETARQIVIPAGTRLNGTFKFNGT
ncbi:MAG: UTP--glucose-1-phosphate uridylyltransferase [Candidatus Promineifilaceae bacterium]|nr:UTP--glucose-1-phosphate uridylyltransferase [Candidatus Promineifilaceae bacterium]